MNRPLTLAGVAGFLSLAWTPAFSQYQIPETSGFGGFLTGGVSYVGIASNFLVGGSPLLLKDVSDPQIASITESPNMNTAPGLVGGGEINYTFASSRTQLYFGNRLEDLLRLDLVFGLGIRQGIGNAGILAGSYLITPTVIQMWSDPYVEGLDREPTDFKFPGFRLRWAGVFATGLELTFTDRFYQLDKEASGEWLVAEGRLEESERALLDRNGDILRFQALYRFRFNETHLFEPAIRWASDNHDGRGLANQGPTLKLTYIHVHPKVILDANALFGTRKAKEINPIYNTTLEFDRIGAALVTLFRVKKYSSSALNIFVAAEYFNENANVDFFDTSVGILSAGFLWRHIKK